LGADSGRSRRRSGAFDRALQQTHGAANALRLHWIGAPAVDRNPAGDAKMAASIESFVGRDPAPVSQFVAIGGEQVFRTVYPSLRASTVASIATKIAA